jgi:hypothetical protein
MRWGASKFITHSSVIASLLMGASGPALAQVSAPPPAPVAAPAAPVAAVPDAKMPSFHVRCDGNPPRMSDIETFARVVSLIAVVGLLAPQPEQADASKRLFGDKGVEACNALIEAGAGREKNTLRLLPLILARSAHHIEAKQYKEALADVALARGEAKAAGLVENPYFARSMGLSFDRFESFARLRMGDAAGAREVSLGHIDTMAYSFVPVLTAQDFAWANRQSTPREESAHVAADRLINTAAVWHANRLEELGRFAEAADLREAILNRLNSLITTGPAAWPYALAAISHALAGDWSQAKRRADDARAYIDKQDAEGKTYNDRPAVVEALDFYGVQALAHEGKLDEARRNFAARSQWNVSYGAILQVSDSLRKGAKPEQLFGALAKSADEQWEEKRRRTLAQQLQSDTNNQTLFSNILPYAKVGDYEKLSRNVWRTDKSRMLDDKPMKDSKFYTVSTYAMPDISPFARQDALVLHCALMAKAKGFKGFLFIKGTQINDFASVMFGNPGDANMPAALYSDADAVIAELRQVIPPPEELEARQKAREKAASKS